MGNKKFLIDTNVAIEYLGEILTENVLAKLDKIIDSKYHLSVINKIELLGFSGLSDKERKKFQELIDSSIIINLTEDIVNLTIRIRKKYKIKLPDSIIAASALNNDLILITRNTKDFDKISGLNIIDPYNL